jgi:hypothetical protein
MEAKAGALAIRPEAADEPASLELVHRYLEELHERIDLDVCSGDLRAEADAYRPPSGAFLVVRQGSVAVGCGAIRSLSGDVGELKRMWVLRRFEAAVSAGGCWRRWRARPADSATGPRSSTRAGSSPSATALYRRAGYREVPAYNDNVDADVWLEKAL